MGSFLMLAGIGLLVLGLGGRTAFGISDRNYKKNLPPGEKMPRRHKGGKRISNTGIGSGAAAVVLALLMGTGLGFGGGSGDGTGQGDAAQAVSTSAEAEAAETAAETDGASELIVRVHNTEIYVGGTLCGDADAFKTALEAQYADGMTILLQDDYADNAAFTEAEGWLTDGAYAYKVETVD